MHCQVFIEINKALCREEATANEVIAALHRHEGSPGPAFPCELFDLVSGLWTIDLPERLASRARKDKELLCRIEVNGQVALVLVEVP